jgi:TRAP-type uncharacterized transport system fused permease subunit
MIYYFCVFCYIQLTAKRLKLRSAMAPVNAKQLLLDAPVFVIPIGLLVFLLDRGYSLPYVGFWSTVAIVVLGLLGSIRIEARLNLKQVINDIYKSAETACQIAVICALIGVVATCIKVSGLGIKLPLLIKDISGGIQLIALFIAMVSSILLGMGVPTAAAYMLVAIGAVPALIEMGVPLLSAHLFCFIFAAFSHITPPVAIGALVAARMAEGNYWQTNWEAIKAAFVAFLLPYFIVYLPLIIMKPEAGAITAIMQIASILVMVIASQICLSAYCFELIGAFERAVFLASSFFCAVYIFIRQPVFFAAGAVLFVAAVLWQYSVKRKRRHLAPA